MDFHIFEMLLIVIQSFIPAAVRLFLWVEQLLFSL